MSTFFPQVHFDSVVHFLFDIRYPDKQGGGVESSHCRSAVPTVVGAAISAANNQYVDAARTIGASHLRIVFRHIVPNVIPVVIVIATVNIGAAILAEAAISRRITLLGGSTTLGSVIDWYCDFKTGTRWPRGFGLRMRYDQPEVGQ